MSHFTVLVIGGDVEDQLAPFQENNMGDCPAKYLEFTSTEEEDRERYETESGTTYILGGKELTYHEYYNLDKVQKDLVEKREIPFKDQYPTFEAFCIDYLGRDAEMVEKGKIGYLENPNAKWDWYQIGGRWSGYFKLKSGCQGNMGDKSWATDNVREGYVDQLIKKDLDLEGMLNDADEAAGKEYDQIVAFYDGEIPKLDLTWSEIIDGEDYKKYSIEQKREIYHGQPAKILQKEKTNTYRKLADAAEKAKKAGTPYETKAGMPLEGEPYSSMLMWHNIEDYQCTREKFVERRRNAQLPTYAVIKDGEWYEKGSMGWWGIATNEMDQHEWNQKFMEMFNDIPDNEMISIVDCHI